MIGSAAASWPLAARAQQPGKLPTIGFLGTNTASAQSQWTAAFVQRLRELGWVNGHNIAIEYRWAEGRTDRFGEMVAEFIRLRVDVFVTHSAVPVLAAMQTTSVVPIVFAVGDPLGTGLVASLARPGGNATGLSFSQLIFRVSNSNCCARLRPVSASLPSWRMWDSRLRVGDG